MPQTKTRKPDSRGRAPPPRSWLQWSLLVVALDRAAAVLSLNRAALDQGAHLLIERETLTRDELPRVTAVAQAQPHAQPA